MAPAAQTTAAKQNFGSLGSKSLLPGTAIDFKDWAPPEITVTKTFTLIVRVTVGATLRVYRLLQDDFGERKAGTPVLYRPAVTLTPEEDDWLIRFKNLGPGFTFRFSLENTDSTQGFGTIAVAP